jgi:hypothetical protein
MKTNDLIGDQLDWAVAKCERVEFTYEDHPHHEMFDMHYSTDWSQGGPIIEREEISITNGAEGRWIGAIDNPEAGGEWDWRWNRVGPTPLIAAMRCFVTSKLGDTVEIPEELK